MAAVPWGGFALVGPGGQVLSCSTCFLRSGRLTVNKVKGDHCELQEFGWGSSSLAVALLRPKMAGTPPDSNCGCWRLNAGRGTKTSDPWKTNSRQAFVPRFSHPQLRPVLDAVVANVISPSRQRDHQSAAPREHDVVDAELKVRSDPSIGPLITPDSAPDPPSSSPGAPMPTTTRRPHTPHGEREQANHRHLHAPVPVTSNLHDPVRHRHEQR
jgi:hypothetical protein